MPRKSIIIQLTDSDLLRIKELAAAQTQKYGHDRWHFTLWREDSSHIIGFIWEVWIIRFLKDTYKLQEPDHIGLEQMGDKFDVYIIVDWKKHKLHIKTGRRADWPKDDWAFGIHQDQKIEKSPYPVILVSVLKDKENQIRIEWFIKADALGKCTIIKKWEIFPRKNYPSRCDNWLTLFHQYEDIHNIIEYLKTISPSS